MAIVLLLGHAGVAMVAVVVLAAFAGQPRSQQHGNQLFTAPVAL